MVARYRLILALLLGFAFTGFVSLLLNVRSSLALFTLILLMPGGLVVSLFSEPGLAGPPLPILVVNGLVSSAIAYVSVTYLWRAASLDGIKSGIRWIALPAICAACLSAVPSIDPLWPKGMSQLEHQEKALRNGLPVGLSLDSARAFLQKQGVNSYEFESRNQETILNKAHTSIVTRPGDRVITAKIDTQVEAFPCGFVVQVVLVFDTDEKLRQPYVERDAICP
jgi:hypothetical protein